MKVFLINPNSSGINKSWAYRRFCTPIAPLGLCYLAAVLRDNGVEVSVIDQFASKIENKKLIELIAKEKPEIVGFSVLTPLMPDVEAIAKWIKRINPECKIVLGNIHPTCFPQDVLKNTDVDIVVRGEAEITMLDMCKCIEAGRPPADIKGISYRDKGEFIHNPERELLENLDDLPYPAWDLLDIKNYFNHPMISVSNKAAFPILASRGCNYRCYYCSQDKLYKKMRYRDLERVADEMEYFNRKLGIMVFGFCDAYFPFDEESGLRFCDIIKQRGLHKKVKWITETRVDKVSSGLLGAMKEAGLYLVMYGIEVGNKEVLKSLNKGTTLEQAREAVRETKKQGILTQGLFILGLPGETWESCCDTIKFAKELNCDIAKFNIATPYPGSQFFKDYQKGRTLLNPQNFTSWADWAYSSNSLVYSPEGMNPEALRHLQRKAMFEFYTRPGIIFRHIRRGTINLKNIFYGGLWLALLFFSSVFSPARRYKIDN